ncbi:hypothetical protein [Herbaspirillum rubrisubalbicans]|uniref:hypothetical protein n=1 Tax=Herbaspirillum rubrisubalbicans TaxID=80842 RepID=UPI0015C530C3|nr:hypothetical protein [Herbaspirillum rubrisubalbicans]NQE51867.1 hypothetical protein [Herbaspirillum rubrisubalbicans]
MKLRHSQTEALLAAFRRAGIYFQVWEITDDSNPYGHAGEDLIISRHGDRQGFIFQNENGGRLLWTAPAEIPSQKRRVIATHDLLSEEDAEKIVLQYSLIFGGPLVA